MYETGEKNLDDLDLLRRRSSDKAEHKIIDNAGVPYQPETSRYQGILDQLGTIPRAPDRGLYNSIDSMLDLSTPLTFQVVRHEVVPGGKPDIESDHVFYYRGYPTLFINASKHKVRVMSLICTMPLEYLSVANYCLRAGYEVSMFNDATLSNTPRPRGWLTK
jgi:hypothetical protein